MLGFFIFLFFGGFLRWALLCVFGLVFDLFRWAQLALRFLQNNLYAISISLVAFTSPGF